MKSWQRLFATVLVLLILPNLAHGWWRGGFFHRGGYYRAAYYGGGHYGGGYNGNGYNGGGYYGGYGYPVSYAPAYAVYPAPCGVSLPVAVSPTTYATTQPAPPSQTNEPPAAASTKKGPTITESRSLGGTYPAADEKTGPLRVGFWNITGKDVSLKVNGETHVVPRNRALNLRLDRNFTWQADGEAKQEQVAESQTTHEVILR